MKLLLLGLGLVLAGAVLPFLMVMKTIPPSFLLSAVAYSASLAGLMLAFIGASRLFRRSPRRPEPPRPSGECS